MRATKLVHEVRNHSVEMESVVKSFLGEVNKVVCYKSKKSIDGDEKSSTSDGHLLGI